MENSSLKNKKIFFLGTPDFAAKILENLAAKNLPIARVITQPDKAVGRKKQMAPPAVKTAAEKLGIPVRQFAKLDQEAISFFREEKPDLILVVAYGAILPKEILDIPEFGCVNLHPSKLPLYRGPSPMQTAILDGEKETALSVMLMDEKMDHGDVLLQKDVTIAKDDTYQDLENRMVAITEEILIPALEKLIAKEIQPKKQQHEKATFCKIIKKSDGKIDWNNPAQKIYDQYRAFHSWPKVFSFWNGKKVTFHEMEIGNGQSAERKPGEVFMTADDELAIAAPDGYIIPKKIQLEGKNVMDAKDFLNGHKDIIGKILK